MDEVVIWDILDEIKVWIVFKSDVIDLGEMCESLFFEFYNLLNFVKNDLN